MQLPQVEHATVVTSLPPYSRGPVLSVTVRGTDVAGVHLPFVSSTTRDWFLRCRSVYCPPATQYPVATQVRTERSALDACSADSPGSESRTDHLPAFSVSTKGLVVFAVAWNCPIPTQSRTA